MTVSVIMPMEKESTSPSSFFLEALYIVFIAFCHPAMREREGTKEDVVFIGLNGSVW